MTITIYRTIPANKLKQVHELVKCTNSRYVRNPYISGCTCFISIEINDTDKTLDFEQQLKLILTPIKEIDNRNIVKKMFNNIKFYYNFIRHSLGF